MRAASSAPLRKSAAAAGASFSDTMAMPRVEVVAMVPSVIRQVTVGTAPDQSAAGVKLKEPSAATVSEPTPAMTAVWPASFDWPATEKPVTDSALSTSTSLVRTLPVTASAFSRPSATSAEATGASLTGVTTRSRTASARAAPSVTVQVTVGAAPNQLGAAVKT